MNDLNGRFVNVVLTIEMGRGMDFLQHPVKIIANFNGRILESDLIEPCDNPQFSTELVWETEKKDLRKIRSANAPVRAEVITENNQRKERIGFVLLSTRSAIIMPLTSKSEVPHKWQKLLGVATEYRTFRPELFLSLTIRDLVNQNQDPHQTDLIIEEESEPCFEGPFEKDGRVVPINYLNNGYIQIGEEECNEKYLLTVIIQVAYNLDLLLPEVLVFNQNREKYFVTFKIFGITIKTKPFCRDLHANISMNEKIVIRIISQYDLLQAYLTRYCEVVVCFFCGNDKLGMTKLNVANLLQIDVTEFINRQYMVMDEQKCLFKFPSPHGITPTGANGRQPYIEAEIVLKRSDMRPQSVTPEVYTMESFKCPSMEIITSQTLAYVTQSNNMDAELSENQSSTFNDYGSYENCVKSSSSYSYASDDKEASPRYGYQPSTKPTSSSCSYEANENYETFSPSKGEEMASPRSTSSKQSSCCSGRRSKSVSSRSTKSAEGSLVSVISKRGSPRSNKSRSASPRSNKSKSTECSPRYEVGDTIINKHVDEDKNENSNQQQPVTASGDQNVLSTTGLSSANIHKKVQSLQDLTVKSEIVCCKSEYSVLKNVPPLSGMGGVKKVEDLSKQINKYQQYCLDVVLENITFKRQLKCDKLFIKFKHPKASTVTTIVTEIDDHVGEYIILENARCKMFFVSSADEIRRMVYAWPPKLTITDGNDQPLTEELDIYTAMFLGKDRSECSYITECKALRTYEPLAKLSIMMYLQKYGLNAFPQPTDYDLLPPILDEHIAIKELQDLQEWKEIQKMEYSADLKILEKQRLADMRKEWSEKKRQLEEKLSNSVARCEKLSQELQASIDTIRTKRELDRKVSETSDLSNLSFEDVLDRNSHKYADHKKMELIVAISNLERENENLKEIVNEQRHEMQQIKKTALTKEQTTNLLQQLRGLEEKFEDAQKAKMYFKDQWKRAVQEIHDLRAEDQKQIQEKIKNQKIELSQLSLDTFLTDNITSKFDFPKKTYTVATPSPLFGAFKWDPSNFSNETSVAIPNGDGNT